VPGAAVECGCWKGGNGAFMAKVSNRQTWLFDSFEGLPIREEVDHKKRGKTNLQEGDLAVSEQFAEDIVAKLQVEANTHIVKGWFENSLPEHKRDIGVIALLRIDGDFYSSTKTVLRELYDQVAPGGYIIFDDFHDFEGCRKAVYEFFRERRIQPDLCDYYPMGKPYIRNPL